MRQVLLIGKFDEQFQEINTSLNKEFQVQNSVINIEIIKGLLKIGAPDAIVITLTGADKGINTLFAILRIDYPDIPIITIGTAMEEEKYRDNLRGKSFHCLRRPVSEEELISKVKSVVGDLYEEEEPQEKRSMQQDMQHGMGMRLGKRRRRDQEESTENTKKELPPMKSMMSRMSAKRGNREEYNRTHPNTDSHEKLSVRKQMELEKKEGKREYHSMKAERGGAEGNRLCILIIDDDPIQLRTMNEFLAANYDVQLATSAMRALTLIGKRVPDMIFLDYDMPMCDGKMTLQMIREVEEAKNIPVVFLTGVQDRSHINAVLAMRPAGYLLKPVPREVICDTIQTVLHL